MLTHDAPPPIDAELQRLLAHAGQHPPQLHTTGHDLLRRAARRRHRRRVLQGCTAAAAAVTISALGVTAIGMRERPTSVPGSVQLATPAPTYTVFPETPTPKRTVTVSAPSANPAAPMQANGRLYMMSIGSRDGSTRLLLLEQVDGTKRSLLGGTPDPGTVTLPEVGFGGANAPGVYFGIFPDGAHNIDPVVHTVPGTQATVSTMDVFDATTGRHYLGVAVALDPARFPDPSTVIAGLNWIDSAGTSHLAP